MKKRLKPWLLFLLAGIVSQLVCTSCNKKNELDVGKYETYQCFDYHLACLNTEKDYVIDSSEHLIQFKRIPNESDDQFIYASVFFLLGQPDQVVMQNPDNYIDVLYDWTITKIELLCVDLMHPISRNGSSIIPNRIIASTTDSRCFSDLKDHITSASQTFENFKCPTGYAREHIDDNGSGQLYYIRVYFNESKNIIWDSEVICYSSQFNNRLISIDGGRQPEGLSSIKRDEFMIDDDGFLYEWLSGAFDDLLMENQ